MDTPSGTNPLFIVETFYIDESGLIDSDLITELEVQGFSPVVGQAMHSLQQAKEIV